MRRWLALLAATACAPPGQLQGVSLEPGIRLVYPDPLETTQLPLDEDGELQFLVVVELLGMDFVEPSNGLDPVDGEGHWHLFLDEQYTAPKKLYHELVATELNPEGTFTVGTTVTLSVDIRNNDHSPFDSCDPSCTDSIEFTIAEFDGGT